MLRNLLARASRTLLRATRENLLPRGLALALVGVAGRALAQGNEEPLVTCYLVAPPGPALLQLTAFPDPTNGARVVRVTALGRNYLPGRGGVAGAELFIGSAGEPGTGTPMKPGDGAFDSDSEWVYLDLNPSAYGAETLVVYVSVRDSTDWSPPMSLSIIVTEGDSGQR